MSLRWKFSLIIGLVAAASALAASTVGYMATKSQLLGQVNDSISARAERIAMLEAAAQGLPIDDLPPGPNPEHQGSPRPGLPGHRPEEPGQGEDGTENRLFVAQAVSAQGSTRQLDGVDP